MARTSSRSVEGAGRGRPRPVHSLYSPSSSHRWLACPGSVQANANRIHTTNIYAEQGTAAHALLEACMLVDDDPQRFIGHKFNNFEVDEDMATAVGHAVDYVRQYVARVPGATYHAERKVPFGKAVGEDGDEGTSDLMIDAYQCGTTDEIVWIDYKHGAGVPVEVVQNSQLMLYALGYRSETKKVPSRYRFVIIQPRSKTGAGPVQEWTCDNAVLNELQVRAKAAIAAAKRPNAQRVAGLHCRFCAALPTCRTAAEAALQRAVEEFSVIEELPMAARPRPSLDLTASQLADAYGALEFVEAWATSVRSEAARRLMAGQELPGYKLVAGRRRRIWKPELDDAAVRRTLTRFLPLDTVAPRVTVSFPQARKLLVRNGPGIKAAEEMMTRGKASIHVAPISDPRPSIAPASMDFEELEAVGPDDDE